MYVRGNECVHVCVVSKKIGGQSLEQRRVCGETTVFHVVIARLICHLVIARFCLAGTTRPANFLTHCLVFVDSFGLID